MSEIIEFINEISSDGWISFFGSLIGAFITAISIVIALYTERKRVLQKKQEKQSAYYNSLLESLPSIWEIYSQADYLNDEDGLLGSFTAAESRIKIMTEKMNSKTCSEEEKQNYLYKIRCHEKYLKYWNDANNKINDFIHNGNYNVIMSECEPSVILAYNRFLVAFQNEHNYSGPVITTEVLKNLMSKLFEEIERVREP